MSNADLLKSKFALEFPACFSQILSKFCAIALAVGMKGDNVSFWRIFLSAGGILISSPEESSSSAFPRTVQKLAFSISAEAKGNAALGICEEFQLDFFFFLQSCPNFRICRTVTCLIAHLSNVLQPRAGPEYRDRSEIC